MDDSVEKIFSLKDKVAIVTGASRGIGKAVASAFCLAGCKVAICSRKKTAVEKAVNEIKSEGGQVMGLPANVSHHEERERLVNAVMEWSGRIDILVNNVGANPVHSPLAEVPESAWDKVFDVNLKSTLFMSQLVYKAHMGKNGGSIINIASSSGYHSVPGINAYGTAKCAVIHLTKCLAHEWGINKIRVNALSPGLIKTDMSQVLWESEEGKKLVQQQPSGRIGEVKDMVGAALLLASDAGAYITGHSLLADGGELLV